MRGRIEASVGLAAELGAPSLLGEHPVSGQARPLAALAVSAFALLAASPAFAQVEPAGPQAAPPSKPDVVIVTGVGPARTSDEMIANTTALDSASITERLSGGLGDTLAGLPGVSSTSFGPGASRPIIRGLGAERVQVLANGIGVVDASAASPDHATTADPLGAERIEILRGPASLAYGGGATGGVVNVIDGLIVEKLPEKAFSGALYGALTSVDDGKQAAARVNARFGSFVAVVNASTLDTDDTRIPGYAYSDTRRAADIAAGASPSDFARDKLPNSAVKDTAESFGLSWVGDTAFFGAAIRQADNRYGIVGEEESYIDMHQTRYDFRGGLNFDDGFLKSVRVSGSSVDYEHTEFEGPGEPGTVFTNTGWEARLEAAHASYNGLDGSFGVQLSDRDFAAVGDEALVGPTNTRQTGVYIFETYDAGKWGLEGGLRHDDVDIDNIDFGKKSFEAVNASIGAHVHLSDRVFLGFSVARTEAAPTDVELFANGPHPATQQFEVGSQTLGTETGINYELSARWEGDALKVSGSLYRFEFGDFIYLRDTGAADAGTGLPIFRYDQKDANFTGAELSADLKLGTAFGIDWKADAGADYVRAEFASGGYVPRIPAASVNVGLEGRKGGASGRISAQYGAEQTHIAAFETPTDDYLTFDARASFDLTEHVQLILEAKNLTDEEVRLAASPLKDVAPQPGRNFRAALRATF